ncbi:MAG: DUF3667 domain-containing protein [Bacteroidota bacterium]
MTKKRQKQKVCPNCNFPLGEDVNFCPQCGQENHVKIQSLKNILGNWMESLLNIDTRLLRTIRVLLTSPGKITKLFQAGKHVSYVAPLRLYLFSSVVMFFMLNLLIKDQNIGEFDRDAIMADTSQVQFQMGLESGTLDLNKREFANLAKASKETIDSVYISNGRGKPNFFERTTMRQVAKMVNDGQSTFIVEMVRNTSIAMFILMPLFGLCLYLFFRKKTPFYVTHMVFSIHYHAVLFLFLTVAFAVRVWVGWDISNYALLGAIVYQILALKNMYQYPWPATFLKFIGVNFLYLIILGLAVTAVSIISLFSF